MPFTGTPFHPPCGATRPGLRSAPAPRRSADWGVGDTGPGGRGIGGPARGIAQNRLDVRVLVNRIGLVPGAEVENPSGAAPVGQAGAEHLATLEPGDEHRFQRFRHEERLAVHLGILDRERGAEPLGNRMGRVDDPDALALARLAPAQRARRSHQPLEDLREMARVEHHEAHALPDALHHAIDHGIGHLGVGLVAPPEQDIRCG